MEKEGSISWRMLDSRAKGLIERVGARANMDAESIHSPNAGLLKRITRLILDCKIEGGEKKRKRKGGTGRDGDIEERKAYLWRNIDLWRGSVSRGRETVPLV